MAALNEGQVDSLSLAEAVSHLLEECRMVLPGVQALFGFQLIAVFSAGFEVQLSPFEQRLHLLALALVAMAGALVMAPAAYHRQTRPREASEHFLSLGGRLLLGSMIPLLAGIGIDFYLISRIIMESRAIAALLAILLMGFFASFWFLLPRMRRDGPSGP
jgi:hypothetical protein